MPEISLLNGSKNWVSLTGRPDTGFGLTRGEVDALIGCVGFVYRGRRIEKAN
jgi:hypothetical protein